jgi:NhaP-type Na+/H+ and K+/H+ antiporter
MLDTRDSEGALRIVAATSGRTKHSNTGEDSMGSKIAVGFFAAVGFVLVIGLLIGYPVMWMVNYLFTPTALIAVFGVPKLSFWQAFTLSLLASTLFSRSSTSSSKK